MEEPEKGQALREARRERGLSLEEAERATKAKGNFQHIVVVDRSGTVRIISARGLVKSLVRSWEGR